MIKTKFLKNFHSFIEICQLNKVFAYVKLKIYLSFAFDLLLNIFLDLIL